MAGGMPSVECSFLYVISNVAKHAWTYDHRIDFENAEVIDKGNFRTRKTLESWHTALTTDADNNSCPLPGQYTVLIKKQS